MTDISRIKEVSVAVLGDVILDEYIYGRVSRISPEAPVPVLEVQSRNETLGGAGNVARNISSLGGRVCLFSVIGNDQTGEKFLEHTKTDNICADGIIKNSKRITTLKQRVVALTQQIVRIDSEVIENISEELEDELSQKIEEASGLFNALVISDYDKGVITTRLLSNAIKSFRDKNKPIVVDPNVSHFYDYAGSTVLTPNHLQVERVSGKRIRNEDELFNTGKKMRKRLGATALLITRGECGMAIIDDKGIIKIPTVAREVYDVTGAGDTVVALLAMGLGAGFDLLNSSKIANAAAGIVVGKRGTAVVTPDELALKINELSL